MRGTGRGCLNFFGGLSLCLQLKLFLRGCWKIRSLPRLVYSNTGLRSKVFVAAFMGVREDELNYIFFDCRVIWLVWNLCLACLDISSVAPLHAYSHLLQF